MLSLHKAILSVNYKVYPYLRDFILATHIWVHKGRQKFVIGITKRSITRDEVEKILYSENFEQSICSWVDDGEVLSMRKREGVFQYHVRYFVDGELRGHFEYSPESYPIKHLRGELMEPKKEYFTKIFKEIL